MYQPKVAVENRKRPSVLALSRQKLPNLPGTSIEGVAKGGYIITDNSTAKAADELRKEGKTIRVVSFVSWELFDEQSDEYKESVLPSVITGHVSIEAGSTFGYSKIVGSKRKAIGIDKFEASTPTPKIYKEHRIKVEAVIAAAKEVG